MHGGLRPRAAAAGGPSAGRRTLIPAVVVVLALAAAALPSAAQETSSTTAPPTTGETTTTVSGQSTTTSAPPTTLSEEERRQKAAAAGNLNAARAADAEIAAALRAITEAAQTTQSNIDKAQHRLDAARETLERATAALEDSVDEEAAIEAQLMAKAVEGFKSGVDDPGVLFSDRNMNQTLRQTQLLQQANSSTAELLEELRTLRDDRRVARAEAEQAAADAAALERQLIAELETLRDQELVQLRLRGEAQARIARWESELTAYAAEDEAIRELIGTQAAPPASEPRIPSALGFQWPLEGRVTSGYGYRIHPVYGTRKLHAGLDVGAPRGTAISSTSGGTVIFVGWRGGYGNTVIVDHGNGVTSLYAHMSSLAVSEGGVVERGDVVGRVGATGTATGNHLHFEIRINGSAVDPAPYLP